MTPIEKKKYIFYLIWLFFFIIISTKFYNENELIDIDQLDSYRYLEISKSAPGYVENEISYHHAQRFIFPYLTGIIAKSINIDVYKTYTIINSLILIIIILANHYIVSSLKFNYRTSIIYFSLLVLNPYLFRYSLAIPTMINDTIFQLSVYLFIIGLIIKNNSIFISICLGLMSRQNGIFLLVGVFLRNFLRYKKLDIMNFLLYLIIFLIIFFLTKDYAENVSTKKFDYQHVFGLFNWIESKFQLKSFLSWALLPIYSYLPALILLSISKKIENLNSVDLENIFTLSFIFFSVIGIAYLSGPELSGRNIIRLTSLVYMILIVIICIYTKLRITFDKKYFFYFFIFTLHLWSLHPTYSKIEFLKSLKIFMI